MKLQYVCTVGYGEPFPHSSLQEHSHSYLIVSPGSPDQQLSCQPKNEGGLTAPIGTGCGIHSEGNRFSHPVRCYAGMDRQLFRGGCGLWNAYTSSVRCGVQIEKSGTHERKQKLHCVVRLMSKTFPSAWNAVVWDAVVWKEQTYL